MRKIIAALAVLAVATPAFAVDLTGSEFLVKIKDHSAIYDAAGSPVGLLPMVQNPGPGTPWILNPVSPLAVGNEQRTIFQATTIFDEDGNADFDTSSPTELTGVLANLVITKVTFTTATNAVIDFGLKDPAAAKNLRVFEDATKDYDADPANAGLLQTVLPTAPGAGVVVPVNGAPNQFFGNLEFPTVTDGTLWLEADLVDLSVLQALGVVAPSGVAIDPGTLLREEIDFAQGSGHGFGYFDVTGGSYAGHITQGYVQDQFGNPTDADLAMLFDLNLPIANLFTGRWQDTLVYQGPGYWTVDSEDPVVFGTIPEPASLTLLSIGGLAVLGLRRRK